MRDGAKRIAEERTRQIEEEGYDAEHDDGHSDGVLGMVGAALAIEGCRRDGQKAYMKADVFEAHPWVDDLVERHSPFISPPRGDRIRCLEIAGALIAAEIDRFQRSLGVYVIDCGEKHWVVAEDALDAREILEHITGWDLADEFGEENIEIDRIPDDEELWIGFDVGDSSEIPDHYPRDAIDTEGAFPAVTLTARGWVEHSYPGTLIGATVW